MGKHKKEKKHKHKKKHKRRRSSSSSMSSEDEWVEKRKDSSSDSDEGNEKLAEKGSPEPAKPREDWMSLPASFLTASNLDRRREREENKRLERERNQYNPSQCSRELNPYWKDGGDGLPKFKKPTENDDDASSSRYKKSANSTNVRSGWRKKRDEKSPEPKRKSVTVPESTSPTEEQSEDSPPKALSDKELNMLAAKLVKAEIMGNQKLIKELKEKLESAREAKQSLPKAQQQDEDVILTQTDSKGQSRPLVLQSDYGAGPSKRKKQKVETHKDGERVRYFADDDKYSLKQMFQNEKFNTVEDQNSEFLKMASKVRKNDDMDEVFADNIRKEVDEKRMDDKNRDRAIGEHHRVSQSLDTCRKCLQSDVMPKHLMVSMNTTAYLSLPPHEPLTEGHCLIAPIRHVPCATQLDENEWEDVMALRRALTKMFESKGEDVVFFETAMALHRYPHMHIECVPLPKEEGDMAPIYFKKAIDESETEWAQNKKLISMKGKDVRRAVPKGLAYFSVSFGMEEGFAHVIEDEQRFPRNFAQEILGGMLDLHHSKWRKPKQQSFQEQSKRILEFSKQWNPFDCTVQT